MATVADLIAPRTAEGLKTSLLDALRDRDFPVTSWAPGDVARTLVEIDAEAISNAEQLVARIAEGGLGARASGAWLTIRARNIYGIDRLTSTFARGICVLTASPNASLHAFQPGQLWVRSTSGYRYTNTMGGMLMPGGTLHLEFRAESPGSAYNVAPDTITTLLTPLPGVSVSNPIAADGTWLTEPGSDEESDASLYARVQARWAEVGAEGATAGVYRNWAFAASPQVRRVQVRADAGTGVVNVLIAGDSGALDSGVVTDVRLYLAERAPLCVQPVVASAVNRMIYVEGTIYVRGDPSQATGIAEAERYIREQVSLGGVVYRSQLVAALSAGSAVRNVALVSPAADVQLAANEVAIPDTSGVTVVTV